MAIEFRRGGRKVSSKGFVDGLLEDAVNAALDNLAEEIHAKAASVVDPETGKHAPVFVRKVGQQLRLETAGSQAFARELEKRLGLEIGEVNQRVTSDKKRLVYLAHATEDKALARPIAEGLIARSIDVWYDQWEIGLGDSVRRKMEEGLGDCTHFVALPPLSPARRRRRSRTAGRSPFAGIRRRRRSVSTSSRWSNPRICGPRSRSGRPRARPRWSSAVSRACGSLRRAFRGKSATRWCRAMS